MSAVSPSAAYLYKGVRIFQYSFPDHQVLMPEDSDLLYVTIRLSALDRLFGNTFETKTQKALQKMYNRIDDLVIDRAYKALKQE